MIRDLDIRQALRGEVARRHDGEIGTLIVEELGLCQGVARVDLAVVNDSLHGYEIKSERDTLDRLPGQVAAYKRALNYVTIVVSPSHAAKAINMIPLWWGVMDAVSDSKGLQLKVTREPRSNPDVEPFALAQFLWREEALRVLIEYGLDAGIRSKPREVLWNRLASEFSLEDLGQIVREHLKSRGATWRSPALIELGGDSHRPSAGNSRAGPGIRGSI